VSGPAPAWRPRSATGDAREARQSEITEELIDLVTGAEAANREDRRLDRSWRQPQQRVDQPWR
jgi:hypothetical protein